MFLWSSVRVIKTHFPDLNNRNPVFEDKAHECVEPQVCRLPKIFTLTLECSYPPEVHEITIYVF
jgi:hypothetical protein